MAKDAAGLTPKHLEQAMEDLFNACVKSKPEYIYVNGEVLHFSSKTPEEQVCNPQWLRRLMSPKVTSGANG